MLGIIGKKIGMMRMYDEKGKIMPCTIIQAGPCVVTQHRTEAIDGYNAIQIGYDEKKPKNTTNPLKKHFEKAGTSPKKRLVEFRNFAQDYKGKKINLGDSITIADIFKENELIDIVGTSKGKGFQGVVKRHNFKGVGGRTHGQHNRERAPGSIGAGSSPSRVFKGQRMAGQHGNKRVKIKNLKILKLIPEENCIVLKGCVPGARNGYITLEK